MMLDKQNMFSDQQALGTSAVSTNSIDLWGQAATPTIPGLGGTVLHDLGRGAVPGLLVQVTVQPVGGTSVQAQIIMADDDLLTSNVVVLQESIAILTAALVPGYQFRLGIPVGVSKRYLGVKYVISGTYTAGNVSAGIVWDKQSTYVG